jgi:phospholipase C
MRIPRRRVLQSMSAAALAQALPSCAGRLPADLLSLSQQRIKRVVVLMLENRSFDHLLGGLSLVEGRTDIDGLRPGMGNPSLRNDMIAPFEADTGQLCIEDPPHGWGAVHEQINGGTNDGFAMSYQRRHGEELPVHALSYLRPESAPTTRALLEDGTLCQRWFSAVPGPTWPNRYFLLLGTSHGKQRNDFIEEPVESLFYALWRAGVPWANYYGNIPFGVVLNTFSLDDREVRTFDRFYEDAAAGTLPSFTLIDPTYGLNDDHPPVHPLAGQLLVQSIYDALSTGPHWHETMFIITYDEHGGFYDHVKAPTIDDDRADEGFGQLGVRVPSLVLGPWCRAGVDDIVYNHASVWRTLDDLWGIGIPNARVAASNSLLATLDEDRLRNNQPRQPLALAPLVIDEDVVRDPACSGARFHGQWADTHQPELEALFLARFPDQADSLLRDASTRWSQTVRQARDRGLWVPAR